MTDLYKALAEIDTIRGQLARGMQFRGYGPATHAATAAMAVCAAILQRDLLKDPLDHIVSYLSIWTVTATLAVTVIALETIARSRRVHYGLAIQMIHSAVEQFLPAVLAGLLLTVVLVKFAPQSLWMLPGLWQLFFSLGVFASCRFLPRPMFAAGVWYLACGLMCLTTGADGAVLSPWTMGVPFGVGQLLVATVLQFGYPNVDE